MAYQNDESKIVERTSMLLLLADLIVTRPLALWMTVPDSLWYLLVTTLTISPTRRLEDNVEAIKQLWMKSREIVNCAMRCKSVSELFNKCGS